ncbi:HAD hydrolase-like protein [Tessaracoccus terricola]
MTALIKAYDAALFDLDGVIYLGPHAIDGVPEALQELRESGAHIGFVTNNAARTPAAVAEHLVELGIEAVESDVVNSTQATLRMLAADLPEGARILVVGTEALASQLAGAGFTPVHTLADEPVAVVQGYHPEVDWKLLELGAIAIQGGAAWYATNPDMTRPTERGILPGCGAQVAVVRACVDVDPKVAGKPFRPLLDETVLRLRAQHPVFVGDRLDTDILGANTVGMESLFVFTGAHGKTDLAAAAPEYRPTHISWDVSGLLAPARTVELTESGARCGDQQLELADGSARLATPVGDREEQLDALWAALQLRWQQGTDIAAVLSVLDQLR